MVKNCTKCQIDKELKEFSQRVESKDGFRNQCRACCEAKKKEWKQRHQEREQQNNARYYQENKAVVGLRVAQYHRERLQIDIGYKLAHSLRKRTREAFILGIKHNQSNNMAGSAVRDLGCTPQELSVYLKDKFWPGMTFENYGEWHIDHKTPLSSFDLTDREQFKDACHYTNLQPLWAKDNLKKSDKIC